MAHPRSGHTQSHLVFSLQVEASSSDTSKQATGDDLRKASLYIFLVMSCLLFLVTVTLVIDEHVGASFPFL